MLQRIQTVFLLLAVIAQALLFFLPFASYTVGESTYDFTAFGLYAGNDTVNLIPIPFYIIVALICVLLIAQIMLFANRAKQIKVGSIAYILTLLQLIPLYYYVFTAMEMLTLPEGVMGHMSLGFGFGMPLVTLFFVFLANRAIRKDEALVKSVDRIR